MEVNARGRLIYVEPNNLGNFTNVNLHGNPQDNSVWNPEDLNYSVDLQVVVPDRTQCGGDISNDGLTFTFSNINSPGMISFFEGTTLDNKKMLTDNYTDACFSELHNSAKQNKECLGIKSINVDFESYFYPQVTIEFSDVRALTLFGPSETGSKTESFFKSVFHYPYPKFLLTIKGFYGTKVTFKLAVNDFISRLNQNTGNFDVTITFIGYMFGVYTDIPTNLILIAPYIGSEEDGKTNSYWNEGKNSGRFIYNDEGQMLTMVEFCDKYVRLAESLSTQNNLLENNEGLDEFNKANNKLSDINEIIDLFNKFISKINMGDTASCEYLHNNNMYLFFGDSNKIYLNKDGVFATLMDKLRKFNTDYNENIVYVNGMSTAQSEDNVITVPLICNGKINPNVTSHEKYKSILNEDLKDGEGKKMLALINENVHRLENKKWYLVDSRHFLSIFQQKKDDIGAKIKEVQPEAEAESLCITEKELGFKPNLENIFRMVFAHIDCFMHFMYDVIKKIKDSKRRPKDLAMETKDSDLLSSYEFIPPFPLITEIQDNKRVAIFPGEKEQYANMDEVTFVNDIIKATLSYRKLFNAIEDYLDKVMQSGDANSDFVQNFFPIMVSDMFYNGANPYSYLNDSNDLGEVLYMFLLRYRAAVMTREGDHDYAEMEARNFYLIKPSCSDEFLRGLRSVASGGILNFTQVLKEYLKKQNNHVIDIPKIIDNTIKTNQADKYPLSFNNLTNAKATQVIRQRFYNNPEKGNLESGFGIKGEDFNIIAEKMTDFSKINEKLPEDKRLDEDIIKTETGGLIDDDEYLTGYDLVGENVLWPPKGRLYLKPEGNNDFDQENNKKEIVKTYTELVKQCQTNPSSVSFPFIEYGGNLNLFVTENGIGGVIYKKTNKKTPRGWEERALMFLACLPFSHQALKMARYKIIGCHAPTSATPISYYSGISRMPKFLLLYICGTLCYNKNPNMIDGLKIITSDKSKVISIRTADEYFELGTYKVSGYNMEDNNDDFSSAYFSKIDDEKKQYLMDYFKEWANGEFKILFEHLKNKGNNYTYKKVAGGNATYVLSDTVAEDYLKRFYASMVYVYTNTTKGEYDEDKPIRVIELDEENGFVGFCNTLVKLYDTGTEEEMKRKDVTEIDISKETRLSVYLTLKKMYDKWLCGINGDKFQLGTYVDDDTERRKRFIGNGGSETASNEFTNFLFMDTYMNDIGGRFMVNPKTFYSIIKKHSDSDENTSVFQFLSDLSRENKLQLLSLPVYNNFHDVETLRRMFSPNPSYAIGNTALSKMGETYVVMYQHEVSSMLEESNAEGILYGSNGFDIADSLGNTNAVSMEDVDRLFNAATDETLNINVPAFGVTFGRQGQSMFKGIKVNMDGPRVTDFSIANTFELGKLGANGFAREPYSVGQDMFAIYSNRSYNCEVEMMGCANIFPFMYFQLNNVPMFKGAYIITDVKHNIVPGDMTTTFTGVRVSKNQIPFNTDIFNIRSFLAMIDGYVKNGGRYDRPALMISGNIQMNGDGSGVDTDDDNDSIVVNVNVDQKKYVDMNRVLQVCREGWYRNISGQLRQVRKRRTSKSKNYPTQTKTCTEGPKTWYEEGFKQKGIKLRPNAWNANGQFVRCRLSDYGFVCVAKFNSVQALNNFKAKPGDIATMFPSTGSQHMCMWDGRVWVSDFVQNNAWVYGSATIHPSKEKPKIWRFDDNAFAKTSFAKQLK